MPLAAFPARTIFYEMFFEDAQAGAQLLNLSLTARNGIPMCGLPHHAANGYIQPHPEKRPKRWPSATKPRRPSPASS